MIKANPNKVKMTMALIGFVVNTPTTAIPNKYKPPITLNDISP